MNCPFIKAISKGISAGNALSSLNKFDNDYVKTFCRYFSRFCPVVGKSQQSTEQPKIVEKVEKRNCSTNSFDYEGFFEEKITQKKASNSYRVFKRINRIADEFPYAINDRSKILVWCSNDYLGLSRHEKVVAAANNTISMYGVGSGGTRNISGNQSLHEALEHRLAEWYSKQAGLVFSSCYVANATTLQTLGKMLPGCVIFSDEGNHASMIEGIRYSKAEKILFRHNDPHHLEETLARYVGKSEENRRKPKIVAFESLNSMNGSIAPIKKMCQIARNYGALTFLDEVHAVGLYGHRGSGQSELQQCLDWVDIISGTMGKAVGSMGGFIVGSKRLVDTVRSYGSGFIFTTSLPPVLLASALASLEILSSDEGRQLRKMHQNAANNLRLELTRGGFPLFASLSHILPVYVGDAGVCKKVADTLLHEHGMYLQAINYPTVREGTERLRIAPTPFHNEQCVERLMKALFATWREHNMQFVHQQCGAKSCSCVTFCSRLAQGPAVPIPAF